MTEQEIQKIFKQCQRFFNHHSPVNLKDQLKLLAEEVSCDEGIDFYGAGKLIDDFEKEVAIILGKPKSVFMPSGTMAQAMALRIWCNRNQNLNFGLHPTSHLEKYEEKAYVYLHNLKGNLLGELHRVLSLNDIQKSEEKLAAVIIELPQRESGGLLPEWDELKAISKWCKTNNVFFHLDGARLWECGPYYQKSYSEICALFDSVYVSFYKGLGGMGGAILAGPEDFIKDAKIWQRRQGGNLITLYPYVVSARMSLRLRLEKMKAYYDKAREIAATISTIGKIKIEPSIPQSNMMNIFFEGSIEQFEKGALKVAEEDKVLVFRKLQPTSNPSVGKFELSVGDAILDISNEEIYRIIKKIVEF
jgi:threonine aldolase